MNAKRVMSGFRLCAAIAVAALLFVVPNISNAIRLQTTWAQRVDQSEAIVRAEVTSVKSGWNAQHTMIYTTVTLRADEYLKGQGAMEKTVIFPGGTVGEDRVSVSDVPTFAEGDYGIILLTPSGYVVGGPDGFYRMASSLPAKVKALSSAPGEDSFQPWLTSYLKGQTNSTFEELAPDPSFLMVPNSLENTTITGVNPTTISSGTGDVLTVRGSGFGSAPSGSAGIYLRYKNGIYSNAFANIQSWSDTQIALIVKTAIVNNYDHSPGSWSNDASGQGGTVAFINSAGQFSAFYPLSVPFGYGRAKWNSSQVTYYVNASGGPAGALAAIQSAATTWSSAGGISFAFQYAQGWSGACELANDGVNKICFAGGFPDPNIIAWAASYISGGVVLGSDIQFNTDFPFSTATSTDANHMDLQTIAVHEMGHWLRLLDLYGSNDSSKIMYGYGSLGLVKRSLTSGDLSGVRWIYPVAGTYSLTVTKTGQGMVISNPQGINCGADCSESYANGVNVTLTATPSTGYSFVGWSGACSGTGACVVAMTAPKSVAATFTAGQISLGEALDNTSWTWTTIGNVTWRGQTQTSYFGGSSAQSGQVGDSQSSHLNTVVIGPATLTYYWKVSSELRYDFLALAVDGTQKFAISGEVDWEQKTVAIPAGQHTLRWSYGKDGSVRSGSDAGWVDKVVFTGGTPGRLLNDLVVDFGPSYGIYAWVNGTGIVAQLHSLSARSITAVDFNNDGKSDLVVDFGPPYGIYAWVNGTGIVAQLHSLSARSITAVDFNGDRKSDLVVDFGPSYGIYTWVSGTAPGTGYWASQIISLSAQSVTAVDFNADGHSDLTVDFGPAYGIYTWVGGTAPGTGQWVAQIHSLSARSITAVDFNADGHSDLAVDFGPSYGIYTWVSGTAPGTGQWVAQIHSLSAQSVTLFDYDNDGSSSDLVVDFGPLYGIYAWETGTVPGTGQWVTQIHSLSAKEIDAFKAD